jgi:sortase (surface protein transpeptidase)
LGDKIAIQMGDSEYVYEVQNRAYVTPDALSFLGSREEDWLTLFTCYLYDKTDEAYGYRFGVQAVGVEIR